MIFLQQLSCGYGFPAFIHAWIASAVVLEWFTSRDGRIPLFSDIQILGYLGYLDKWILGYRGYMDTWIHGYQFSLDTCILGYFGYQIFSLSILWISYPSILIFLDTFLNYRTWKKGNQIQGLRLYFMFILSIDKIRFMSKFLLHIRVKKLPSWSPFCYAHIFKYDIWHFEYQIFRHDGKYSYDLSKQLLVRHWSKEVNCYLMSQVNYDECCSQAWL